MVIFEQLVSKRREHRLAYNRKAAAAARDRTSGKLHQLEVEVLWWRSKVEKAVEKLEDRGGQEAFIAQILATPERIPKDASPLSKELFQVDLSAIMDPSSKNATRESEIALLEQLSSSLDQKHGAPDTNVVTSNLKKKWPKSRKSSDASKNATKNFLATKTLVKAIVKACNMENVTATSWDKKQIIGVMDSLVEEYRQKYPALTKQMVVDGIARHNKTEGDEPEKSPEDDAAAAEEEEDHDVKVARLIEIVDEEMDKYFEKVEAIKNKRRQSAENPELDTTLAKKKKDDAAPKKKRGRPKKPETEGKDGDEEEPKKRGRPKKDTPEVRLLHEITVRYAKKREEKDRLPNGELEDIVEETKKDMGMEDFQLSLDKIRKRVTWNYMRMPKAENSERRKKTDIVEEVYQRYSRTKASNGGKLPPGTLDAIVEGVKLEYGMPDVKLSTLESMIQARFKKEHPEFKSNPTTNVEIRTLSEEDQRKRQILMNEVTHRYVKAKEGQKKLPDGSLDRIITQVQDDLGIHGFQVPKASIRGRVNRKSLSVMTLGEKSPYDIIDETLVSTINNMLSQGISVTRAQGLEMANTLLKGKKREKDDNGEDIFLDAKWWRNFLERNKKRLVCS